jgi:4'-phosphopantetheinyl transferase
VTAARPDHDEVHLWQAPLDLDRHELAALESLLSTDERERAARFRLDRDRARYAAARGWLRRLIARYLDVDAAAVAFGAGAFGKPELTHPAASWLRFNAARSADLAVFAVASDRRVGVDVERVRADFPVDAVANRFLPSDDRVALAALPPDRRGSAFFDMWARREAYLKGLGVGLGGRDLDGAAPADLQAGWSLTSFDAGDAYAAAVAVEGLRVRVPDAAKPLPGSSL